MSFTATGIAPDFNRIPFLIRPDNRRNKEPNTPAKLYANKFNFKKKIYKNLIAFYSKDKTQLERCMLEQILIIFP